MNPMKMECKGNVTYWKKISTYSTQTYQVSMNPMKMEYKGNVTYWKKISTYSTQRNQVSMNPIKMECKDRWQECKQLLEYGDSTYTLLLELTWSRIETYHHKEDTRRNSKCL